MHFCSCEVQRARAESRTTYCSAVVYSRIVRLRRRADNAESSHAKRRDEHAANDSYPAHTGAGAC